MNMEVSIINAFGKSEEGGNGAGVLLDANNLSEEQMQKIAKEVGLSETAFVKNSSVADFKVRFFTPVKEVDLCGHATIATFYLLKKRGLIKGGNYTQETKAGVLNVQVNEDNSILMDQSMPEFYEKLDKEEIAKSLNINVEHISDELPVQIVSTGLKDVMVPIKSMEILNSMEPDFEMIRETSKKYEVVGYHAFSLETIGNTTAHCRNFAPLYDILEESATGTSNGALSSYLYEHGKLDKMENLVFEQGYAMRMPSEIKAALEVDGGKIKKVKVGGIALEVKLMIVSI
ncbi:MAG: PhzF family phenazine biosynthesis protein [Anaeromicrobium sp.]|jgi:PhzF family phenazine biosynthesis protein|uniref:PhzF family phenazine biosynthesis protein n=1 Tax=Anaeromicrobium sp. TaxID=1929132 RepID=UPI0025DD2735|nr:PhzF family phenazine biosynthesis protein [Anaeromicrobium sp.]MCT4595372.1 PhzF family phenazine biosynthesis protein [Anaeromicrobium sp.]